MYRLYNVRCVLCLMYSYCCHCITVITVINLLLYYCNYCNRSATVLLCFQRTTKDVTVLLCNPWIQVHMAISMMRKMQICFISLEASFSIMHKNKYLIKDLKEHLMRLLDKASPRALEKSSSLSLNSAVCYIVWLLEGLSVQTAWKSYRNKNKEETHYQAQNNVYFSLLTCTVLCD